MSLRNTPSGGAAALGCLAIIITVLLAPVMHGIVLSTLWGWFVSPTFGLARLGIANAIGLSILVGSLNRHGQTADEAARTALAKNKTFGAAIWKMLGEAFIAPLLVLLSAWIVTLFM